MNSILSSFKLKDTLNPDVWTNTDADDASTVKLDPEIRRNLLVIAKKFVDSFNLDTLEIEDVCFLGSLANFNWSKFSDVDLHVLIDKSKISKDAAIVNELCDAKKEVFNNQHDIKIKGYDVELYAQDINEENESGGVYSILYNKWIKVPTKDDTQFNKKNILKKVKEFTKSLSTIEQMEDSDEKVNKLNQLKDKIKKYRKTGLSSKGEMSDENLVFKYLRRSGFIERLINLKINTTDTMLSVDEAEL